MCLASAAPALAKACGSAVEDVGRTATVSGSAGSAVDVIARVAAASPPVDVQAESPSSDNIAPKKIDVRSPGKVTPQSPLTTVTPPSPSFT